MWALAANSNSVPPNVSLRITLLCSSNTWTTILLHNGPQTTSKGIVGRKVRPPSRPQGGPDGVLVGGELEEEDGRGGGVEAGEDPGGGTTRGR